MRTETTISNHLICNHFPCDSWHRDGTISCQRNLIALWKTAYNSLRIKCLYVQGDLITCEFSCILSVNSTPRQDKFLGAFAKLRRLSITFVMSVRPSVRREHLGSHWTDFNENLCLNIFFKLSRKFKFHENRTRITSILRTYQNTFLIYLAHFILEWKMLLAKVVEKAEGHNVCLITFFLKWCRLWGKVKNIVERDRPQMTIWCMRIACWINKATHTHTHTHTHRLCNIIAFPQHQCLHERASMSRCTYIGCLIYLCFSYSELFSLNAEPVLS